MPMSIDRSKMRGFTMKKRSLVACPAGYIKRAAFVRRTRSGKRSYVPEQCIPDVGRPGKGYYTGGPGIGSLRKGELAKHGYSDVANMSASERHAALDSAISEFGSLGVWRKLNAVAIYTRRTAPEVSTIFKQDMDWIRKIYGIKAFD